MASKSKFRHEDVSAVPRGWKVRTVRHPSGHQVRIAFPAGPRRTGSGRLVSLLHPETETNPCPKNPLEELVKDSKGRQWWVSVSGGGEKWRAEGFPVSGGKIKTVGRPVIARGITEAAANDALVEKMEGKNPKRAAGPSTDGKSKGKGKKAKVKNTHRFDELANLSGMLASRWAISADRIESYINRKFLSVGDALSALRNLKDPPNDFWKHLSKSKVKNPKRQAAKRPANPGWNMFAGGTGAAEGKHSYQKQTDVGEYDIQPFTTASGRHAGYQLHHVDTKGVRARKGQGGLWLSLGVFRSPGKAKSAASKHEAQLSKGQTNPKRRKNLDEIQEAQKLYEAFQGKSATGVIDVHEPDTARDDFAMLGWLISLTIQPRTRDEEVVLNFRTDKVRLASNAEGSQLYCIGGSQNLNGCLAKFKSDESKDFVELGEAIKVVYLARKAHTNFEPTEWEHTFGEEGGEQPFLFFDRLKKRVFFVGGDYKVQSPGIID